MRGREREGNEAVPPRAQKRADVLKANSYTGKVSGALMVCASRREGGMDCLCGAERVLKTKKNFLLLRFGAATRAVTWERTGA